MINFEFKWDAKKDYEFLFSKYSTILNGELKGSSVLIIYRLMMTEPLLMAYELTVSKQVQNSYSPGVAQIYGDESNRVLK
jgi:alpha-amylase